MRRALQLAATPGVPLGPNPRVGCVLLADDGTEVAEGFHRGAGTPHAEVAALDRGRRRRAGHHRGGHPRAVQPHGPHRSVRRGPRRRRRTPRRLRPARPQPGGGRGRRGACARPASRSRPGCSPTRPRGSTGPGPSPSSTGGPSSPGSSPPPSTGAAPPPTAPAAGSPAAPPATTPTGCAAQCDTMLVGTSTVEVDDPLLTVRDELRRARCAHQPLRAVMGQRDLDPTAGSSTTTPRRCTCAPATPPTALRELLRPRPAARVAGGRARPWPRRSCAPGSSTRSSPTSRPSLLGAGTSAVGDLGITTIADQLRFRSPTARPPSSATGADANVRHDPREDPLMFTGIVEELGTVAAIEEQGDALRLSISAATVLEGTRLGDSIAVNGCCLTVTDARRRHLDGRRDAETLDKTSLAGVAARRPGQPRAGRHRRDAPRRPHRPGPRRRRRRGPAPHPQRALGGRRGLAARAPRAATSSTRARSPSTASASPSSRPASELHRQPHPRDAGAAPRSGTAPSATGSTSRPTSSPSTSRGCSPAAASTAAPHDGSRTR